VPVRQTSKTLNYLDSPITVPYFSVFISIWIYLRHYLNLCILWATCTTFRTLGPWRLDWDTGYYKSPLAQKICLALLASLQAMNLFWLFLILRVAYNIAFREVVEDVRSEGEESDEDREAERSAGVSSALEGQKAEPWALGNGNGTMNGTHVHAAAAPTADGPAQGQKGGAKDRKNR
jgi:acyl-CoA-dependent ceramide synthase